MDLYRIVRGVGSLQPEKTLRTYAYNDKYSTVHGIIYDLSCFTIRNASVWSGLPHFNFVQKDGFFYISAHEYVDIISFRIPNTSGQIGAGCVYVDLDGDGIGGPCFDSYGNKCAHYAADSSEYGYCWHGYRALVPGSNPPPGSVPVSPLPYHRMFGDGEDIFSFPAATGTGNITNVAIWAYAQGKCKPSIKVGSGTKTYGAETSARLVFRWNVTNFATKPGGASWSWSDLSAGNVQAGIYLYCNTGKNSGICRHLKLVVTSDDGSEVEIWPSGDVSATCRLVAGNHLLNSDWAETWAATGSITFPVLESTTPAGGSIVDRYIASELSEVPPRFSEISGITVSYSFRASSSYGSSSYARAFLEIAGTKYYGTQHSLGSSTANLQQYSDAWTTNPATGAAWAYDDFVGIRFGVWYHAGGTATATYMYLFSLMADTSYRERKEVATYEKIDGAILDSHTQNSQNPIKPDELLFYLPPGQWLPERTEIAYLKSGVPVFQGVVWSNQEQTDGSVLVFAKSQQVLLIYRNFPASIHRPRVETFDSEFTIDELFSDDVPTYPGFAHIAKRQNYTTSEVD